MLDSIHVYYYCRILYMSLHRYDNGLFYPGSHDADYNCVGGAGAEGFNINVAWNWDSMGDAEYLSAFHYIIMPVAYEVHSHIHVTIQTHTCTLTLTHTHTHSHTHTHTHTHMYTHSQTHTCIHIHVHVHVHTHTHTHAHTHTHTRTHTVQPTAGDSVKWI